MKLPHRLRRKHSTVGLAPVVFAGLLLLALIPGCTTAIDPNFTARAAAPPIAPEAAQWQTWVLASSAELRPAPPPDAAATAAELEQLQAQRHQERQLETAMTPALAAAQEYEATPEQAQRQGWEIDL